MEEVGVGSSSNESKEFVDEEIQMEAVGVIPPSRDWNS